MTWSCRKGHIHWCGGKFSPIRHKILWAVYWLSNNGYIFTGCSSEARTALSAQSVNMSTTMSSCNSVMSRGSPEGRWGDQRWWWNVAKLKLNICVALQKVLWFVLTHVSALLSCVSYLPLRSESLERTREDCGEVSNDKGDSLVQKVGESLDLSEAVENLGGFIFQELLSCSKSRSKCKAPWMSTRLKCHSKWLWLGTEVETWEGKSIYIVVFLRLGVLTILQSRPNRFLAQSRTCFLEEVRCRIKKEVTFFKVR